MKLLNTNICLTSRKSLLVMITLLISSLVIAGVVIPRETVKDVTEIWIPTAEDVKYQDSLWNIINQTQQEVDTIKVAIDDILWKLDRLEYEDGTWDSVRVRR